MASKKYSIQATLNWARVFEQNRDKHGPDGAWEDTDGVTSVEAVMDAENLKKFKASGSRMKIHETEDGEHMVTFRRPWANVKYEQYGGEPAMADIYGKKWTLEDNGFIGNGSVGIIKFTVYDTAVGKGTRLESIQILEHVPYESDFEPADQFEDLSGGEDTPKPKKTKAKPKAKVEEDEELDDEIPF